MEKPFSRLPLPEEPALLRSRVRSRIAAARRRRALGFGGLSFVSALCFLAALSQLSDSLSTTGFWGYVSLIFSEGPSVASYMRELSFAVFESLPVMASVGFLAAACASAWSLSKLFLIKRAYSY
jgi:hypothetical protein